MYSLIESRIKRSQIKYFNYAEFSDIVNVAEGRNGNVRKANWDSRRMPVALKVLKTSSLANKTAVEEFVREFTLLQKVFYHPNINQYLGITKDPIIDYYVIVLQYAEGGNLRDYLNLRCNILTWFDKCRIALEIAKGLLCLHAEDIIHRSLHPKNVLVRQGRMLIADFGISKKELTILSEMPAYVDPRQRKQCNRNKASDIFSFGVLLWEIYCGKIPFAELSDFVIRLRLVRGIREQRVDGTPEEYFKLYTKCWDGNPEKRPKIEEVVDILEILEGRISLNDILCAMTPSTLQDNGLTTNRAITPSAMRPPPPNHKYSPPSSDESETGVHSEVGSVDSSY